jgi:hypothetical protein
MKNMYIELILFLYCFNRFSIFKLIYLFYEKYVYRYYLYQ